MKLPDVELPSNRKFGFFFTFVFLVIAWRLFTTGSAALGYLSLIVAAVFLLVTMIKADLLLPLNKGWMAFGLVLGMIVSPIVLGIIYFGLFTPVSLVMKAVGRDELGLKLKRTGSHWKVREEATAAGSFKNQF
ncbi:SxtJ family membrane protein [Donghicola sp. XS_ASV15]|uniref:SxtJ family membrane protein n=1 Tax=Donghicola sp. XS_ASV15 TaxID=3241295 RepID=UPI00351417BD